MKRTLRRLAALLLAIAMPAAGLTVDGSLACATALARTPGGDASLPATFDILSWNVHKLLDPGATRDLGRLAAELMLLQEALPDDRLGAALPPGAHVAFTPAFRLAGDVTGVMTVSPAPPSLTCRLLAREPWLGTPKGIAVTRHGVEGGARLLTINIHGVNLSLGTRVFAEQLGAVEPLLAAHDGPVILGGDVNAWSRARLKVLSALAQRHDLAAVRFDPDRRTRFTALPMDYLYQRGLEVLDARALPVDSSDHNPLRLRVTVEASH